MKDRKKSLLSNLGTTKLSRLIKMGCCFCFPEQRADVILIQVFVSSGCQKLSTFIRSVWLLRAAGRLMLIFKETSMRVNARKCRHVQKTNACREKCAFPLIFTHNPHKLFICTLRSTRRHAHKHAETHRRTHTHTKCRNTHVQKHTGINKHSY